jgi:hypothetical protein
MASEYVENAFQLFFFIAVENSKRRFLKGEQTIEDLLQSVGPDSDAARVGGISAGCRSCGAKMAIKELKIDQVEYTLHCAACHSEDVALSCELDGGLQ